MRLSARAAQRNSWAPDMLAGDAPERRLDHGPDRVRVAASARAAGRTILDLGALLLLVPFVGALLLIPRRLIYLVVFLGSMAVDLIPVVAPPAWTLMAFLLVKYHLNP